jgi:hypothetical protein
MICGVPMTWLWSLVSVSSTAAAAVTVTDSVTRPTWSFASTRCRAVTSTVTSVVVNLEKPGCSIAIV